MIKNGRPHSVSRMLGEIHVDDALITDKPEEIQQAVFDWIRKNIIPIKSENKKHTSYGIKHILQNDTNIYLTNNEYKDAMMICGFMPVDEWALNWTYRISNKSPAFKPKKTDSGSFIFP